MKLAKDEVEKLQNYIKNIENKEASLIAILYYAQEIFSYLPEKVQNIIAEETLIDKNKIKRVICSNNFFTEKKKAKYIISLCTGTQCLKKEPDKILNIFKKLLNIDLNQITEDGIFSLETMPCIGACKLAPIFRINKKVYGRDHLNKIPEILEEYKK